MRCERCDLQIASRFIASIEVDTKHGGLGCPVNLCPTCVLWWAKLPEVQDALARAEGRPAPKATGETSRV